MIHCSLCLFFPQKPLERNALLMKSKTLSLPQSQSPLHSLLPCSEIKLLPVLPCFCYSKLRHPFVNIPWSPPPLQVFFSWLKKLKFNPSLWEGCWGNVSEHVCAWGQRLNVLSVRRDGVFTGCLVSDTEPENNQIKYYSFKQCRIQLNIEFRHKASKLYQTLTTPDISYKDIDKKNAKQTFQAFKWMVTKVKILIFLLTALLSSVAYAKESSTASIFSPCSSSSLPPMTRDKKETALPLCKSLSTSTDSR